MEFVATQTPMFNDPRAVLLAGSPAIDARGWRPDFVTASPLHAPIARAAELLGGCLAWPTVEAIDGCLAPRTRRPDADAPGVRFIPQGAQHSRRRPGPRGLDSLYDGRIALRREVATRAGNWHDLLNAMVWATFPRAKWALSVRQCRLHRERNGERFTRLPPARTPEQDALALLDEGAVFVVVQASGATPAADAIEAGDFAALRGLVGARSVRLALFGHAQHEHLVRGDRSARAGAVVVSVADAVSAMSEGALCEVADAALAAALDDPTCFHERPTALGIPLALLEAWAAEACAAPVKG